MKNEFSRITLDKFMEHCQTEYFPKANYLEKPYIFWSYYLAIYDYWAQCKMSGKTKRRLRYQLKAHYGYIH